MNTVVASALIVLTTARIDSLEALDSLVQKDNHANPSKSYEDGGWRRCRNKNFVFKITIKKKKKTLFEKDFQHNLQHP